MAERGDYGVDTGRLSTPLADEAQRIVYGRYRSNYADELSSELWFISEIDRAHLVMLLEAQILDIDSVRPLLQQIEVLRSSQFQAARDRPMPRGLYLAYESYLAEVLGAEVGGAVHAGRSRNDLNATAVKLRAREPYAGLVTAAVRLCDAFLSGAERYSAVVMPAYTHGQAAVPVTYGHYLAGLACSMMRNIDGLLRAGEELETNPLGAGAAGGTSIPIDVGRTTQFLGFSRPALNSIDAVASRDFILQILSAVAILGIVLTRAAHDFASWATEEFGFLCIPDDLVGSSSMMPQKRNPFLLEHVQGKAAGCLGSLVSAASAMSTAGYTNAIAVGTEGTAHLWPALRNGTDAADLLRLIVDGAVPAGNRMLERARSGNTMATYLAELLVRRGAAFRSAHYRVGKIVRAALTRGEPLPAVAAQFLAGDLDQGSLEEGWLDPVTVAAASKYGGGPGEAQPLERIAALRSELMRLRQVLPVRQERWVSGRLMLDEAVRAISLSKLARYCAARHAKLKFWDGAASASIL